MDKQVVGAEAAGTARSAFVRALAERRSGHAAGQRTWLYVPYDQLHGELGMLAERAPEELGIVLIECPAKAARRAYHKQKLALVLANMRHFALEQAARGVAVRFIVARHGSYARTLAGFAREHGPILLHEPAERELRVELAALVGSVLKLLPHPGHLTTLAEFRSAAPDGPPYRMDAFYRRVRRERGVLMENGKPIGGRFSFDAENRKAWRGQPPAPPTLSFVPDAVTEEVGRLVEERYADHPGELDLSTLPATHADAERVWAHALARCLPHFGPYEDAMSTRSSTLFHSGVSALLNLHRLLPRRVLADVLAADLPLPSKEGFVRQLLGWREYMRHVHRVTRGFRRLPGIDPAQPSFLDSHRPLPAAYWGTPSGFHCLDHVVKDVWRRGYSHHITRLMVLSNLANLLDVSPRELSDWFWIAYTDAYDWVVEPNVIAMSTFGVGDVATTKPYVAGAAYIDRMSDYCASCRFDPKSTCPITPMYWAFLARKFDKLAGNPRMNGPLHALGKRSAEHRARDARIFESVSECLADGQPVPSDVVSRASEER